jgi:hypothetical protein
MGTRNQRHKRSRTRKFLKREAGDLLSAEQMINGLFVMKRGVVPC